MPTPHLAGLGHTYIRVIPNNRIRRGLLLAVGGNFGVGRVPNDASPFEDEPA